MMLQEMLCYDITKHNIVLCYCSQISYGSYVMLDWCLDGMKMMVVFRWDDFIPSKHHSIIVLCFL